MTFAGFVIPEKSSYRRELCKIIHKCKASQGSLKRTCIKNKTTKMGRRAGNVTSGRGFAKQVPDYRFNTQHKKRRKKEKEGRKKTEGGGRKERLEKGKRERKGERKRKGHT